MARLPRPGGDVDAWATILNDYLQVTHNDDGSQRAGSIDGQAIKPHSLNLAHLQTVNPANRSLANMVLANDGQELIWKSIATIPPTATPPVSVTDYGAVGDGVTDDTAAIQAALNATSHGGVVEFPKGRFMVTNLKFKTKGTSLVGSGRFNTQLVRLSGNLPLLDISGPGTMDGHLRYCSLTNLMISGNNLPGPLIRSYYADNCVLRDVNFIDCPGLAIDMVEVWDTRFENCTWENCGSTSQPAVLLRNSLPSGNYGYSTDTTNQIFFISCRWEGFRNGAVRLDGAANGSTNTLNGIFFVSCKMESPVLAGTAFQIGRGCAVIYVNQLYMAMMGTTTGYDTPINAIEDQGSHSFFSDVYIHWGGKPGLVNAAIYVSDGDPHMYNEICAFYSGTAPATATVVIKPTAGQTMVNCLWVNQGTPMSGNADSTLNFSPHMGLTLPLHYPASFLISDHITGREMFKADLNATQPVWMAANGADMAGFADTYITEKWRLFSKTGEAHLASGKFQVEPSKGYVGIGTAPYGGIALLIRPAANADRGLAVIRSTASATGRLLEFQDETYNIQGTAFDAHGRLTAVGTPPRVTAGDQAAWANPRIQTRDIAGNINAGIKSSASPGSICTITFARPYDEAPLAIILYDHSVTSGDLYVSDRTSSGFTVSTRSRLAAGAVLNFDYVVVA